MKNCPFCNSDQVGIVKENHRLKYGYCRVCGATGPVKTRAPEAERAWDARSGTHDIIRQLSLMSLSELEVVRNAMGWR